MIHNVEGFGVVNKAEVDVFLELSCFFDDPTDIGNLVFASSPFSKTSLNMPDSQAGIKRGKISATPDMQMIPL